MSDARADENSCWMILLVGVRAAHVYALIATDYVHASDQLLLDKDLCNAKRCREGEID